MELRSQLEPPLSLPLYKIDAVRFEYWRCGVDEECKRRGIDGVETKDLRFDNEISYVEGRRNK